MYLLKLSREHLEGFLPYIPAALHEHMGGQRYIVLGCVSNGYACGAAVSLLDDDGKAAAIRSILVDEKARRLGFGSALVKGLAKSALESGAGCLRIFYALDFSEQLVLEAFLKSCGFGSIQNVSAVFRCRLGALCQSVYFKKYSSLSKRFSGLVPFRNLKPDQLDALSLRRGQDIPAYLDISAVDFNPDISFAAVGDNGIEGYILAAESDGMIEICSAVVFGGFGVVSGAFPALVSACLNEIVSRYDEDSEIMVDSINNTVTGMVRNYTAGILHRVIQGKEAFLPIAST